MEGLPNEIVQAAVHKAYKKHDDIENIKEQMALLAEKLEKLERERNKNRDKSL